MKESSTTILFIVIIGLAGLAIYCNLDRGQDWGDDFAAYIMQAKSIVEFSPCDYAEASRFLQEGSSQQIGPIAYPWGYPLLLAPLYAVYGVDPLALKTVGAVSYLLLLITFWMVFRKSHSASWFLCLVGLFAFNPTLIVFSNQIVSDLPFLLFSTLGIWLIREIVAMDRVIISRSWDSFLLAFTITAAFFIRTNGILLLFTLGISQLALLCRNRMYKGRFRMPTSAANLILSSGELPGGVPVASLVRFSIPYGGFLVAVALVSRIFPDGGASYLSCFGDLSPVMIKQQLSWYIQLPAEFFSGALFRYLIYGASIPLVIAGAIKRFREDYPVIVYCALTISLYVFWPGLQGLRFIYPILPFYLSFAISGLESFCSDGSPRDLLIKKSVCYAPILIVIALFGRVTFSPLQGKNFERCKASAGPFESSSRAMFSYIANHTESDSVVIFFKPRAMWLMAGRHSLMINSAEQLYRGDYLCLVGKDSYNQISSNVAESLVVQGAARIVYAQDDFKIYRLHKEKVKKAISEISRSLAPQ